MKVDLSQYPGKSISYKWTDLVNSMDSKTGTIKGGSVVEIKCPEDYPAVVNYKDWLLYLKIEN